MYSEIQFQPVKALTENAFRVLKKRYLRGETPEEMFLRVAECVAKAEIVYLQEAKYNREEIDKAVDKLTKQFYNIMASLDFLPNSPTLMNAGRPLGQLAACFVVPVEDSMEGIFQAIKDMALIQKTGGGTGFNFSRLRPKEDPVTSTVGEASGPLSFMRVFNAATEEVKQGGARRGANMAVMRIDHPDILEFIDAKADLEQLTNFNMSVAITEEFMQCLSNNTPFTLKFGNIDYAKIDPKLIWDKISTRAWTTGEPGVIFIDEINKHNTLPALGDIESTNPCVVGDTLIKTVEGMIAIKDLVGKEIDVYCVNDKYQLTIRKAKNIRLTKMNAKLLKVSTTKGNVICTPDHKFYTRNRGYIEAQYLLPTDKLVALNVAPKNQRYTKVYLTGTGSSVPAEHIFIAQHYYGDMAGKDVHHKDNNRKNNAFSNLEVLNHGDHSVLSNKGHIDWMQHDPSTGRWLPNIKEDKNWSNKLGVHPVGANMRLLSVVPLDYTEDVYDMEVEECHNFFANYVLIHNCGEQPLLPYEACNLGSINLSNMVLDYVVKGEADLSINWSRLKTVTQIAVRFLDNVIDINKYPLPQIEIQVKKNRKIGLGVMGWANMLFKLGIPYDSAEALLLAERIMHFIDDVSKETSMLLAQTKGVFPNWEYSVWASEGVSIRNATTTTIAPTGTLSIIAGVSSGIEPLFGLLTTKTLADGDTMTMYDSCFLQALENFNLGTDVKQHILDLVKETGSVQRANAIMPELVEVFKISNEIHPFEHIRMQAAFQEYTDNAVSKTINFDNGVSPEEIQESFLFAYKLGCKGITVYRDGSRNSQPLSKGENNKEKADTSESADVPVCGDCEYRQSALMEPQKEIKPLKRPEELTGITKQVSTGCGKMLITVNTVGDRPYETLLRLSGGGCAGYADGMARLISIALRYGVPAEEIIDQLNSVRCDNFRHQAGKDSTLKGKSCPDVIGRVLKDVVNLLSEDITEETTDGLECLTQLSRDSVELDSIIPMEESDEFIEMGTVCPECKESIIRAEGCVVCYNCGFSKC